MRNEELWGVASRRIFLEAGIHSRKSIEFSEKPKNYASVILNLIQDPRSLDILDPGFRVKPGMTEVFQGTLLEDCKDA